MYKKNEPSRASTKWGRVVEDVRTIFEEKNDATVYIPTFYLTPEHTISQ